ncbi:uncharacterized protein BXZ73DRAFT_84010 [Epithele typhae]|uniref:uncharacterized protein n=1 Tax=Epithele typhae TaxID=378194 RepID=UPI0020088571|nr:uncharacterized protein BXZ73DRAFT_84010 [Epithele typhae]KAH9910117.1 hypothetical protein BXZ73DRAFT_84010 [Epithele typhae]
MSQSFNRDFFNIVLDDARPSHLSLEEFGGDLFSTGIAETFRAPIAAQVECLEAVFVLAKSFTPRLDDGPAMVESWLTTVPALSGLKVLSIAVDCCRINDPLCDGGGFFEALDLTALARRFREAIPALEFVELAVAGLYRCEPAVVRDGVPSVGYETSAVESVLRDDARRRSQ